MTGYQEIITDPSYKGQIVAMTYPLIGNYGINSEDVESRKPFVEGFAVKECSHIASNWQSKETLDSYLKRNNIVGVEGIDTRALTRHIRLKGAMKAFLTTEETNKEKLIEKARSSQGLLGRDIVKEVTSKSASKWTKKGKYKIILLDCGMKYNIARELAKRECEVTIVPAGTSAEEILNMKPHGIMLSNGPGDPAGVPYVIQTVKDLLGKLPIFGICLGHQMLGLALGGRTYKLKFGHHGANHPVKDVKTGKIHITVQNHGFSVDIKSLNKKNIEITHINLNDNTLEGMRHRKLPVFSVQFHPEASPDPHDAQYLFDEFIKIIRKHKNVKPKNAKKKRH